MGVKLTYIDNRPVYVPKLQSYPNGFMPAKGESYSVTDNEAKRLLTHTNGTKPCWEKKTTRRTETTMEGNK